MGKELLFVMLGVIWGELFWKAVTPLWENGEATNETRPSSSSWFRVLWRAAFAGFALWRLVITANHFSSLLIWQNLLFRAGGNPPVTLKG